MYEIFNNQVNREDAELVAQQLDEFTKWEEGSEFTHIKGIHVNKLPEFLNHIVECYEDSGKYFKIFFKT